MSQKEFRNYQENRFAVFCRTTIWNARIDNRRSRMNWEKKFTSLDALQMDSLELEGTEDTYVTYAREYRVKGIAVTVKDERLGEALQFILPNQRAVLLLSYFKDYCDMDIARLLKISHKTVAYRKALAMNRLRMLLEGTKDAEKEN